MCISSTFWYVLILILQVHLIPLSSTESMVNGNGQQDRLSRRREQHEIAYRDFEVVPEEQQDKAIANSFFKDLVWEWLMLSDINIVELLIYTSSGLPYNNIILHSTNECVGLQ